MSRIAVPFTPIIKGDSKHAEQAAEQLNALIKNYASNGWRFVQLESVSSVQPSGCLSFSAPTTMNVQVAVFEERRG